MKRWVRRQAAGEFPDSVLRPRFGFTSQRYGELPVFLHAFDHLRAVPGDPWYRRFNAWFALKVTEGVGTMWCAYAFAALAIVSLYQAVQSHDAVTLVSWVSQTFLQLVLLSVIMVGQNVQAKASDSRAAKTFEDGEATRRDFAVALSLLDVDTEHGLGDVMTVLKRIEAKLDSPPPKPPATRPRRPPGSGGRT